MLQHRRRPRPTRVKGKEPTVEAFHEASFTDVPRPAFKVFLTCTPLTNAAAMITNTLRTRTESQPRHRTEIRTSPVAHTTLSDASVCVLTYLLKEKIAQAFIAVLRSLAKLAQRHHFLSPIPVDPLRKFPYPNAKLKASCFCFKFHLYVESCIDA